MSEIMSQSNSEGRYSETCGATNNRGEKCGLPAGWGVPGSGGKRCKFHGGASSGPNDTTHLVENDFAKGNAGGGAPTGNTNAEIHGGFGDWQNVYERLDDGEREYVEWLINTTRKRVKATDIDDERREQLLREWATLRLLSDRVWVDLVCVDNDGSGPGRGMIIEERREHNGETYTVAKANPAWNAETRIRQRKRTIGETLRLFPES